MNQSQQHNFSIAGVVGACVAFIALLAIAFLPRPFPAMDHFSILSGVTVLSPEELAAYKNYVASNLTLDSLYLIGHFLMWLGYSAYLYKSSKLLAAAIAVLGFFSAWLDFTENEIRWASLEFLLADRNPPITEILAWQTTFGLSFWILFLCTFTCGIAIMGSSLNQKITSAVAILGLFIAPLSYHFGFLPAFLWLILWHVVSAVFLWMNQPESHPHKPQISLRKIH